MAQFLSYNRADIEAHGGAAPRYTSYPTAPHFNQTVDQLSVRSWLRNGSNNPVSLYIHIPYCDRLCWFCGCHTQHTKKYEPIQRYIGDLCREVALLASVRTEKLNVAEIHLGGGSPSLLRPEELETLREALHTGFNILPDAQISVEFDPTDLSTSMLKFFQAFGVNRASIGVQDFDIKVQEAINRPQSFEDTMRIVKGLRDHGVTSVNIDALYGLPYQTMDTLEETLEQVGTLDPDRIALFGYAHVPWVKPHQRLIPESALPDLYDRFWQARYAEMILKDQGYDMIGMDHFAKPDDPLSIAYRRKEVRRNFQGYTTDRCATLVGLGVSSISRFEGGYAQNVKSVHEYRRALDAGELPVAKGISFSGLNMAWGAAIDELMTYFSITPHTLRASFGSKAEIVIRKATELAQDPESGLVRTRHGYRVHPKARPFIRSLASRFDPFLKEDGARYSVAV